MAYQKHIPTINDSRDGEVNFALLQALKPSAVHSSGRSTQFSVPADNHIILLNVGLFFTILFGDPHGLIQRFDQCGQILTGLSPDREESVCPSEHANSVRPLPFTVHGRNGLAQTLKKGLYHTIQPFSVTVKGLQNPGFSDAEAHQIGSKPNHGHASKNQKDDFPELLSLLGFNAKQLLEETQHVLRFYFFHLYSFVCAGNTYLVRTRYLTRDLLILYHIMETFSNSYLTYILQIIKNLFYLSIFFCI